MCTSTINCYKDRIYLTLPVMTGLCYVCAFGTTHCSDSGTVTAAMGIAVTIYQVI